MKTCNKISLKSSIFLLAILFTGLVSCNKNENSITSIEKQLIDTVWEQNDTELQELTTITFVSATAYTYSFKDLIDSSNNETGSGTYKYDPPSITLNGNNTSDSGTINGNTMDLVDSGIFTKK